MSNFQQQQKTIRHAKKQKGMAIQFLKAIIKNISCGSPDVDLLDKNFKSKIQPELDKDNV
jgi:hypothetical protein